MVYHVLPARYGVPLTILSEDRESLVEHFSDESILLFCIIDARLEVDVCHTSRRQLLRIKPDTVPGSSRAIAPPLA